MNHQRWVSQLEALVKKNFLLTIRRPALSIAAMIAPAIMVGFIVLAYQSTPSAGGKTVSGVMALLFNQTVPLKLPTCEDSCSKIFFSPNDSYHSGIMERFVLITGMDLARDVESFQSDVDMASAIINRYNLLKGFQFFAGISWTTNQTTAPNATAYTIWTDGPKYGKEFTCDDAFIDASSSFPKFKPYALSFQSQIEAAIVSYLSDPFSNTSANFSVKLNWFQPSRFASNDEDIDGISLTYRPESYCNPASSPDLVSPLVRVLLALGYIPLFTLSMSNISNEKQKRLLYPLRRMGLYESAYWVSAVAPLLVMSAITGLLCSGAIVLAGESGYSVFQKIDFIVLFLVHFGLGIAMSGYGLLWSSVLSKALFVNLLTGGVSVAIVIVNFMVFSDGDEGGVWFQMYVLDYARALMMIFAPWYEYGKVWSDMMNTVLPTAWNNRTAVRFTAAKLSDSFHNVGPPLNTERSIILSLHKLSSTGLSILQLCGSIFVYVGLAWYLNQALPMSDGGFFRPWYFPFTPSYWSGQGFKPDVDKSEQTDDTISREKNLSRQTGSIRLLKISKVYASTTAVKEVSLTMNTGNVYTILGHNGAGKTSLISMLSGVTNPTYGEGFVFGYDLREDVSKVQEIMGCCPQFDALYMRLTPAEHVQFYASFRGVDVNAEAGSMRAFVTQKLAAVGLVHVANSRTGSLSGGMKRRLSLILATIGQIKLVFLDEPTTGMDPMSRRKCWKVIQEMKRGKIVILTTHTMEEADALGDVVCIMHGGRLQAFGTNIFMKSFFGKGYQLSLISPTDDEGQEMLHASKKWVLNSLPGSEIVSSDANKLTFGVCKNTLPHLTAFLKLLESSKLFDWNISNSTLEEVFLKLCAKDRTVDEKAQSDQGNEGGKSDLCSLCKIRPSTVVTLFSRNGRKLVVPYVVCQVCAESDQSSVRSSQKPSICEDGTPYIMDFEEFTRFTQKQETVQNPAVKQIEERKDEEIEFLDGFAFWINQCCSIFLKNVTLNMRERKTNLIFIILIAVINALFVLVPKFVVNIPNNGFDRAPPECLKSAFNLPTDMPESGSYISCKPSILAKVMGRSVVYDQFDPTYRSRGVCAPGVDIKGCSAGNFSFFTADTNRFSYWSMNMLPVGPFSWSTELVDRVLTNLGGVPRSKLWYSTTLSSGEPNLRAMLDEAYFKVPFEEFNITTAARLALTVPLSSIRPLFMVELNDTVENKFALSQSTFDQNSRLLQQLPQSCGSVNGKGGFLTKSLEELSNRWNESYPDFGITFNSFDPQNLSLSYILTLYPLYMETNKFGKLYTTDQGLITDLTRIYTGIQSRETCLAVGPTPFNFVSESAPLRAYHNLINSVTNAFLNKTRISSKFKSPQKVLGTISRLPEFYTESYYNYKDIVLNNAVTVILMMLATSLMFPRLVNAIVTDRSEGLYELCRIQGLQISSYWAGNYTYGLLTTLLCSMLSFGLAYATSVKIFVAVNPGLLFSTFLMWSHAQVCLAFLIAAIFTKPVTAGLASYTVYLVSAAGAPFFLYLADTRTGALPTVSAIYPPLGFISTLNILFLGRSSLEFSRQLGISYASSTALGLLGVFIHAGRGTSGGDLSARNLFSWLPGVNMVAPFVQPDTNVDEDVLDEETSVLAREREHPGKMENDEAIRLVEVKKSYGAKQAVKGVTFSIRYGESFGLLGPNGAGKTTTLSMITGLLRPTSGTIYVAGQRMEDFGINTGRVVGTCPQFDRVWSSMTIEEHLQFYSRLRGIPAKHLKSRVRRIAEEVGLDGDPFQMMADHLSGGMKRRLSIGIALTGSPAILVCDEPSTGLDPETRRQVWKVLSSVKGSNRCLIVTTHAMEEADAICNRIGIVSNGKMRVIGTQNRLKQKFGSGLKISLRFEITHSLPYKSTKEAEEISQLQSIENKRVEEVNAGVLSFLTPEAVLLFRAENDLRNVRLSAKLDPFLSGELQRVMTWSVLLRYGLPQGNVIDIFGKISQFCDSHDIADWELNQTTLDDVFVRVNEQYGGDR